MADCKARQQEFWDNYGEIVGPDHDFVVPKSRGVVGADSLVTPGDPLPGDVPQPHNDSAEDEAMTPPPASEKRDLGAKTEEAVGDGSLSPRSPGRSVRQRVEGWEANSPTRVEDLLDGEGMNSFELFEMDSFEINSIMEERSWEDLEDQSSEIADWVVASQAWKVPDSSHPAIRRGMDREITFLDDFQVYVWFPRDDVPEGTKVYTTDWVMRADGDEVRARLVVQQVARTKREDTFAPTPTPLGLRVLLLYAAVFRLAVVPADMSVAFMHAPSSENTFVWPPMGLRRDGWVWKLLKAMNGLRKAVTDFSDFVCGILVDKLHLTQVQSDPCLFKHESSHIRVGTHVDDPIGVGPLEQVNQLFQELGQWVLLKVKPPFNKITPTRYLGREFLVVETESFFGFSCRHPDKYYESCLEVYRNMSNCKSLVVPHRKPPKMEGKIGRDSTPLSIEEHARYRKAVGKFQFLCFERYDIQYPTKECSKSLSKPSSKDETANKDIVRYLKGTQDVQLFLAVPKALQERDLYQVKVYVDSNWGPEEDPMRRSTSCVAIRVSLFCLLARSITQSVIAQSSGEAEYVAAASGSCEGIFALHVLNEIFHTTKFHLKMFTDSSACRGIANRTGVGKIRHLDLKMLFVQQFVKKRELEILSVSGHKNPADLGTKHHDKPRLEYLRRKMLLMTAAEFVEEFGSLI